MRHIVVRTICSFVFLLISNFFDALFHRDCQLVMIELSPRDLSAYFQNVKTTVFAIRGVTISKGGRRRNFPIGNEFFNYINTIKYINLALNLISNLFSHCK